MPLRELGGLYRVAGDPRAGPTLTAAEAAYRAIDPTLPEPQYGLAEVLYERSFLSDPATAERQAGKAGDLTAGIVNRSVSADASHLLTRVRLRQTDLRLTVGDYETTLAHLADAKARMPFRGEFVLDLCAAAGRAIELALADRAYTPTERERRAAMFWVLLGQLFAVHLPHPPTAAGNARVAWLMADSAAASAAQLRQARRFADTAVALAPADPAAQESLALACYRAGEFPAARRAMEQANRTDRLAAYLTAMTQAATGHTSAARTTLTAAAKLPATTPPGELDRFRREAEAAVAGRFAAPAAWEAVVDLTREGLDAWGQQARATGFVPVAVHAHRVPAGVRYSVVSTKPAHPPAWAMYQTESVDWFQRLFDDLSKTRGVRSLCGHPAPLGPVPVYVSVWATDGVPGLCRHAIDPVNLLAEAAQQRTFGMRLVGLSAYPLDGRPRFITVYAPDGGQEWTLTDELAFDGFRTLMGKADGWRPGPVSVYAAGGPPRVTAVRVRDPDTSFVVKLDLTPDQYGAETEGLRAAGYQPEQAVGYEAGGASRCVGVWIKPPARRAAVPALARFDAAVQAFMAERGIPAGSLAVMKGGKLILTRGYGYLDRERTKAVPPDTPFRIASVSKPITAAAVRNLIAAGRLTEATKVVPLLGLTGITDPRWHAITVGHLLDHRGGLDRETAGDPMFRPRQVAAALKLAGPPSAADVVRYEATRPLQFARGRGRRTRTSATASSAGWSRR